ncbi:hypothetical protein [Rhizobium sp. MHM7A]|uniref:hypothetical protein n=1 Tax=Rhizobium sp. MHM7A TaxID=2583233 RepID=UPI0011071691|nr:hypothetical protein [Rhizobium sp. MHM7A]TLX17020.1 hypothetical protein FFR93_06815 [Rhizobium sp. MHM7A]
MSTTARPVFQIVAVLVFAVALCLMTYGRFLYFDSTVDSTISSINPCHSFDHPYRVVSCGYAFGDTILFCGLDFKIVGFRKVT